MRTAFPSIKSPRLWTALLAGLAITGSATSAATVIVQSLQVPPLWTTTPDPLLYPTDYWGLPPNYTDISLPLAWGTASEPQGHKYNQLTATLHMANALGAPRVKIVWLKLSWSSVNIVGLPTFQAVGEVLDPARWAVTTSPSGTGQVLAAAWDEVPGGVRTLTMKFLLDPQPSMEDINIRSLLGPNDANFMPTNQPNAISVQTLCIPTPTGAAALGVIGGLLAMSRRRHAIT